MRRVGSLDHRLGCWMCRMSIERRKVEGDAGRLIRDEPEVRLVSELFCFSLQPSLAGLVTWRYEPHGLLEYERSDRAHNFRIGVRCRSRSKFKLPTAAVAISGSLYCYPAAHHRTTNSVQAVQTIPRTNSSGAWPNVLSARSRTTGLGGVDCTTPSHDRGNDDSNIRTRSE